MPVGDVTSDKRGSGARYNDGKPAYQLVPLWALDGVARVFDHGRRKYAEWNWAKGMAWSVPLGSLLRHLAAFQSGEFVDPESGDNHMDHVLANVLMLVHYQKFYPELNDLINPEYTRSAQAPEDKSGPAEDYPEEAFWRAKAASLGSGPELL